MNAIERRYCVFEAAFMLRALIGPEFGNIYTILADQRRGKGGKAIPFIRYYLENNVPYYLSTDLMAFVEEVRESPLYRRYAKKGIKPVFREIDIEKEMSL